MSADSTEYSERQGLCFYFSASSSLERVEEHSRFCSRLESDTTTLSLVSISFYNTRLLSRLVSLSSRSCFIALVVSLVSILLYSSRLLARIFLAVALLLLSLTLCSRSTYSLVKDKQSLKNDNRYSSKL